MQEFDLRLGEQGFLPLVLSGQDLCRQQLGDPLPQGTVDGAKEAVFRFVQFDGAHHPLVFAAQGDHKRRAELALGMQRAAVWHFVAVGIHHLARFNGA